MELLSLRRLEELTGKNRYFLKDLLGAIAFTPGPNRSRLYQSTAALPAIYTGAKPLEEARIKQAETAARLNEIRAEELAKKRIPIEMVTSSLDQVLQAMAAALKATEGQTLRRQRINEILEKFRAIPAKLKL